MSTMIIPPENRQTTEMMKNPSKYLAQTRADAAARRVALVTHPPRRKRPKRFLRFLVNR